MTGSDNHIIKRACATQKWHTIGRTGPQTAPDFYHIEMIGIQIGKIIGHSPENSLHAPLIDRKIQPRQFECARKPQHITHRRNTNLGFPQRKRRSRTNVRPLKSNAISLGRLNRQIDMKIFSNHRRPRPTRQNDLLRPKITPSRLHSNHAIARSLKPQNLCLPMDANALSSNVLCQPTHKSMWNEMGILGKKYPTNRPYLNAGI